MESNSFYALLSCFIIPKIIEYISINEGVSFEQAIQDFYKSKTYEVLEDESSKVWHFSAYCLYTIWKSEQETGEPDWPEEGMIA
ncbi:MAG: hypothetical protein LUD51_00140 [Clostridia bacterium]|nr:hypothetical protein [Clostridia bacterium]